VRVQVQVRVRVRVRVHLPSEPVGAAIDSALRHGDHATRRSRSCSILFSPTARSSCAILNVTRYHPADELWYAVPGACGRGFSGVKKVLCAEAGNEG
jgi:hypothetical protein